jgi:hypothetical protein
MGEFIVPVDVRPAFTLALVFDVGVELVFESLVAFEEVAPESRSLLPASSEVRRLELLAPLHRSRSPRGKDKGGGGG